MNIFTGLKTDHCALKGLLEELADTSEKAITKWEELLATIKSELVARKKNIATGNTS